MSKSIRWRLVTIYVLLVVIVMIVSGTLIVWLTSINEYKAIEVDLKSVVSSILKLINTDEDVTEIQKDIQTVIQNAADFYSTKKVYLLDKEGVILYPIVDAQVEQRFYTPQVMAAIAQRKLSAYDEIQLAGESVIYKGYAEPIIHSDKVAYIIYVLVPTTQMLDKMKETMVVIMFSVILAVVVAVFLGFVFSNFLTKPIILLTTKAKEMAQGNLNNPMVVHSSDEIGQLTKTFNIMAASLNDTMFQISSEKNKLETVFHHLTDGILVFDREGRMIHNNPTSIQMLNLRNQVNFREVFHDLEEIGYQDLLKQSQERTIKHLLRFDDQYYNVAFAKYLDKNEEFMGLICVIQDVTEHKKLEEMQKEFVANVSHELRTPLTTIKSYTETLLDGAVDDKALANQFLEVINHEGDRMTMLVQDLLELSRLDNKQAKFVMAEVDLNQVVAACTEKYKIHADKKGQEFLFSPTTEQLRIIGDVNRLEQVVKNVISNAVKYSPEGAKIEVCMYVDGTWAVVRIRDNGMGIPSEDIGRIFERFYRVDKARSRAMGGTGLGLAIAKEIMDFHGARIEVESELEKGTVFYLYFPLI